MGSIWHIGLAVPDLKQGMVEVGDALSLTWRPVHRRVTMVRDERGAEHEIECTFTFSEGSPFAIEMWESIPGTPLAVPESGYLHHIGYWVDDLPAEVGRLDAQDWRCFMSGPSLAIHHGPGGLMLEPCDLQRDRPFLRDLFPAGSPFYGPPDNSGALTADG